MLYQDLLVACAAGIAIIAFCAVAAIAFIVLPRRPTRYLYYGLIGGLFAGVFWFALMTGMVIHSQMEPVPFLELGLLCGLGIGVVVTILLASPYWVSKAAARWLSKRKRH